MTSPERLTFGGKTLSLAEWSKITGISAHTLRSRLRRGWTVAETLETPLTPPGQYCRAGKEKVSNPCDGCRHYKRLYHNGPPDAPRYCDYQRDMGHRRPCPADECTEYSPKI